MALNFTVLLSWFPGKLARYYVNAGYQQYLVFFHVYGICKNEIFWFIFMEDFFKNSLALYLG